MKYLEEADSSEVSADRTSLFCAIKPAIVSLPGVAL